MIGTLLLVLVGLLLAFVIFKLTRVPIGKIPPMLKGTPLIGSAVAFGMDPINLIMNARKQLGDVFTMKIFHEHMIMFVGTEAQEFWFKTPEEVFNAAAAYKFTVPLFGKGVVYDGPPELLIEERKIVSRGLSLKRFKQYVPIIEAETKAYFDHHWGDSGTACLHKTFNEVTVLTSVSCLQGKEIRNQVDEFTKLYWIMDKSLDSVSFFFPNFPMPNQFKRDRARKRVDEIFKKVIRSRRENPEVLKDDMDLIASLMNATLEDGSKLTDDQIVGMMIALLVAGQHTSNVTGTWTGLHLLQDRERLKKVQDELAREIGDLDVEATFESVKECVYLEHCVRESLRLRPPIITIMRRVLQSTTYKGYDIPENTLVGVSVAAANRLPEIYTNPNDFEPERFAEPRCEHKKSNYSFLSFGGGRHACIGESFGVLQTKTIYSWLFRNYDIEYIGQPVKPDFTTMIISPVPPNMVRYKRKTK